VARVQVLLTGGGTDAMTPRSGPEGWVVLAARVRADLASGASLGTVTALNAAGQPLASAALTEGGPFGMMGPGCGIGCSSTGTVVPGGATGTASAGAAVLPPPAPLRCAAGTCGGPLPVIAEPALKAAGHALACPVQKPGASGGGSGSSPSGSGSSGSGSSGSGSSGSGSSGSGSSGSSSSGSGSSGGSAGASGASGTSSGAATSAG
jgi:hypothetical protein